MRKPWRTNFFFYDFTPLNRLQNVKKYDRIIKQFWRDVRAVECARLESGYALTGHRRFKSCSLRQKNGGISRRFVL